MILNDAQRLQSDLLAWYDRHRRTLPWRAPPGEVADPYAVWLSEIMLQQTTVATVKGYFERFLTRWPTVADLAAAPLDDVLTEWAGLGYYARARNLHKCANVVVERHGGRFPANEAVLLELPGIGRYTAAAIAAIAFDQGATVVDGNVERVISRLRAIETPLPDSKPEIWRWAEAITPAARAGDFAQAMMDLGATVCTPRTPLCMVCPWSWACEARAAGIAADLPRKKARKPRPTRYGMAFWLEREGKAGREVLLRRRPEEGLLGGMMEVPSSPWTEDPAADGWSHAPAQAEWTAVDEPVVHVFTHFRLELDVVRGEVSAGVVAEGVWVRLDRLADYALPTVMTKAIKAARG
ncbi:A/G-specific adenine glycosylase [Emcibacter sp. SYSU 3D8]|uniref:A/G-specific adenine glycosylase n=1 Tax=Emcibacter sp. SYSU 3D8 TaxID=3133969 RepID=UPI0031FED938